MFVKIEEFIEAWTEESKLKERIMEALTDASLSQPIVEGRRTLGQIAWHLVGSIHYMTHCGLNFAGPAGGEHVPASAAEIAEEYHRISEALIEAVRSEWTDEQLLATTEIAGEPWPNGASLRFTLMHQAHHRGQMTVLMRQAGLRLPDVYGPTYESWIEQGMEPLA
ncbi:DinB family protein [Paenibacillus sp. FSL R7-0216]|uniref:DinB family protein n=1 Tax=Paenibacillus sp. FSL R7-0216 TaxID=2921677 RepID=UPI0030DA1A18